jgi:hypothetical protein
MPRKKSKRRGNTRRTPAQIMRIVKLYNQAKRGFKQKVLDKYGIGHSHIWYWRKNLGL